MKTKNLGRKLGLILLVFVLTGCVTPPESITLLVVSHNQETSDFRIKPYDANETTFIPKPDPPQNFSYVDFLVVIYNNSLSPLYLDEEQFSFGYYNLELEVGKEGEGIFSLKKKDGLWFRNYPSMIIIPPNSSLAYPVSLDNGIWNGLPHIEPGEELRIRAKLLSGYMKKNDKMVKTQPMYIESDWVSVIFREKRLAHISDINRCKKKIFE